MKVRKSEQRGQMNHGWLDARHTFSFASYRDPEYMGYSVLRVMNEDRVKPGNGFGMHPHNDMEILTYVISGKLEHKDSMENGSVIEAGDFQRMSAGTGILHSEFNPSDIEETHLYQIWIKPIEKNLPTGYEQKSSRDFIFDKGVALIASETGHHESMKIQQNLEIYLSNLEPEKSAQIKLRRPKGWGQVISGTVIIEGITLSQGDGVSFENKNEVTINSNSRSQVIVFDLPK